MLSNSRSYDNQYLLNLLLTPDFVLYENLGAYTLGNHPHAMKASMAHDPYTPPLHESMSGEHRYDFLAAIGKEIPESEQRTTWKVVKNTSLPCGANLLPSTSDFRIKQYPYGRMRKHKYRFCVRGDHQIKNLNYFESYAPVAPCLTI